MKFIGTTETFDPAFVDDLESKLLPEANLIITKQLTDKLIDILIRNKSRCVLHLTLTGNAGTILEPNVPSVDWNLSQLRKLLTNKIQSSESSKDISENLSKLNENHLDKIYEIQCKDDISDSEKESLISDLTSQFEYEVTRLQAEYTDSISLIDQGTFNPNQVVFRIDPIIPFRNQYVDNLVNLLSKIESFCKEFSMRPRVRISMIDMYPHVCHRFRVAKEPFVDSFQVPQELFNYIETYLKPYAGTFKFESCAEVRFSNDLVTKVGCVSNEDIKLLGLDVSEFGLPETPQRNGCLCLAKKQILGVKPGRCPHQCLYCYWKDSVN